MIGVDVGDAERVWMPVRAKAPTQVFVYAVRAGSAGSGMGMISVRMTPDPDFDVTYWRWRGSEVRMLAGPFSAGEADRVCRRIGAATSMLEPLWQGSFWQRWRIARRLRLQTGKPLIPDCSHGGRDGESSLPLLAGLAHDPQAGHDASLESRLHEVVAGRLLTWGEIRRDLEEAGLLLSGPQLTAALQQAVLEGCVRMLPGLTRREDGWYCTRCGSRAEPEPFCPACGRSGGGCLVCRECASLGPIRACTLLYHAPQRERDGGGGARYTALGTSSALQLQLPFRLTSEQEQAAAQLLRFCHQSMPRYGLVEAVCGAGKTEITLPAIVDSVGSGRRVLFAVPRREVVRELATRMRSYLPQLAIAALYGGSSERWRGELLTLATTHQVLRFRHTFHLTFIDEADAFPYRGNALLERAVEQATSPNGHIVYLTATPDPALVRTADSAGGLHVDLSARPHGRPLPPPVLVSRSSPKADRTLEHLWSRVLVGEPLFVFVPKVSQLEAVARHIRSVLARLDSDGPRLRVDTCHAHDPARQAKTDLFRKGEINVLVTTSVMERGVTVPRANVLVWNADLERIYDQAALVQMAGRSGRSREAPQGLVVFLGEKGVSRSMQQARAVILAANERAKSRGLIEAQR